MRVSRGLFLGACGLLVLLALAFFVGGVQGAATNSSRVDAGATLEVRPNEGFDISPGDIYQDPENGIDRTESWWDLDNATDVDRDGNPTNDRDEYNLAFHHLGISRLGPTTFTLWVNYTDNVLANGTRQILVVPNELPIITLAANPVGYVNELILFTVVVTDPDSPESSLSFAWDFDVGADTDQNGVPDDDVDSILQTNVTHAYELEGTYTAKISVSDDYNATKDLYITVTVQKPPGVSEREVQVKDFYRDNITIRRDGWVSYHMKVRAGRLYQYDVEVKGEGAVYVMVQLGQQQFDQYRNRMSQTPYVTEWSHVNTRDNLISAQFRPTQDGDLWITIDNGFLLRNGEKPAETIVVVQDADRNNLLANIPVGLWYGLAAIGAGAVVFYGIRGAIASSAVRQANREKAAFESQEKATAKSELDTFLSNPEAAAAKARAPPPPPRTAPGAPPSAPALRPGQAVATPAPAPATPVAPPAAPTACPTCGTPVEAGMQICPNCGSPLAG
jgi:hypothetical protein